MSEQRFKRGRMTPETKDHAPPSAQPAAGQQAAGHHVPGHHAPEQQTGATPDQGRDVIVDQLRQIYDDVANEPLPTDLLALLERLDEAERKR